MNKLNKKKQSGGILSAIAALIKGGAAAGGTAGAAATGGIFATKAGILGLLLGGATIAAGAGAVYHFAGGSATNTAYTPELFQNSYIEEQAAIAEAERAQNSDRRASVVNSTIGMFSEQAKKSGLGFSSGSSFDEEMPENAENGTLTDEARGDAANNVNGGGNASSGSASATSSNKNNRLASKSFSSVGGGASSTAGSKTVVPRMKSMGGLSGGVNSKFASMKSAGLAEGGRSSGMSASRKQSRARGRAASPRAGGNKSAYGQARFANSMGNKAVYSASSAGARTAAASAFTGETAGGGDISVGAIEGAGMGGAGMSMANGLKANNPNGSRSVKDVPEVSSSEDVSPWKDLENAAMIAMAAGAALLIIGSLLAQRASKIIVTPNDPTSMARKLALLKAVRIISIGVMAAGAVAVGAAAMLLGKYQQKMSGIMYGIAGGFMIYKGYKLMEEANTGIKETREQDPQFQEAQAQANKDLNSMNEKDMEALKDKYKDEYYGKIDEQTGEASGKKGIDKWYDDEKSKLSENDPDYKDKLSKLDGAKKVKMDELDAKFEKAHSSEINKFKAENQARIDEQLKTKYDTKAIDERISKAADNQQQALDAEKTAYKNKTGIYKDGTDEVNKDLYQRQINSINEKGGFFDTKSTTSISNPATTTVQPLTQTPTSITPSGDGLDVDSMQQVLNFAGQAAEKKSE